MNPLAELAQFYSWLQIGVAFIFMLCVMFRPKTFWPLIIIGIIIGQGPRFAGYGFFDEFLVGAVIVGALFRIFTLSPKRNPNARPTQQRAVYYLWIGYMIIESIIGIAVNDDLRIFRWIIFYGLLGIIPLITYHYEKEFPFPSLRSVLILIVTTTLVYYIAYLSVGMIYDAILPHGRVYSQYLLSGFVWSGTAIAAFPALLVMPVAIILFHYEHSFLRILISWLVIIIIVVAGYYYDSRMTHIIVLGCLIPALYRLKIREIVVVASVFFISFFVFFVNSPLAFEGYAGKLADSVLFVTKSAEEDKDADRKVQLQASIMRVTENPVTFFFGDGRYSHRFTLIPHIEELYSCLSDKYLRMPSGTDVEANDMHEDSSGSFTIFRTTGFSGLLVDTGIVGMMLFALNFVYVGIALFRTKSRYRLLFVVVLMLSFAWLFANNITDVLILYLFIMPGGILERINRRTIEAETGNVCYSS